MKKCFQLRDLPVDVAVPAKQAALYRLKVINEMKKMGATSREISLLQHETVINSIRNNRKPEDVAWAILQ